jgi:hypothetical protein
MRASKLVISWRWPRQQHEADQIAKCIDERRDLRSSDRRAICQWPVFESPFCAGSVLMDPDMRRIEEDIFEVRIIR